MDKTVEEIRRLFAEGRERCADYHGIKANYDELQCSHIDNKSLGCWCAVDCCPLLRED